MIIKNIEEVGKEFISKTKLNTDVLFLRGDKSGYIRDEDIPAIKYIFPLAQIETIQDAGHWVHAEQPEGFINACISFLKN